MKSSTAISKTGKRFTAGQLRKRLAHFRNRLSENKDLVSEYFELVKDSDYLRIANTNQANRQTELALDCLVLLLVSVCEFQAAPKNQLSLAGQSGTTELSRFLLRNAGEAADLIAAQMKLVADLDQHEILEEAQTVYEYQAGLFERTGMDCCERLLTELDRDARRIIGLYFTPSDLSRQIVARVTELLTTNDTRKGQGTSLKANQILDPAAGAGVFLLAWLDNVKSSKFGPKHPSDSLQGIELHPAIATLCHCRISQWCEANLPKGATLDFHVHCGDALRLLAEPDPKHKLFQSNVLIGNPPFSSLSSNSNEWLKRLMAGQVDKTHYSQIDGEPINEKKSWLHDDYIKFFRVAHHIIESQGGGVIAFVTNRAYIDNVTFRGMRWQLLSTFDHVEITEHQSDENLFAIATQVATSIFVKSKETAQQSHRIHYSKSNRTTTFRSEEPNYLFSPPIKVPKTYSNSLSIVDAFQDQGSAAITARDWFITDLDRESLVQRIASFCDAKQSDSDIREKFFNRCRSRRYVAGDTRSWQLSPARKWLREQPWEDAIRTCCYRPFDNRWILWLPEMVDWPRTNLMKTLELENNVGLVTRRQFPSSEPACYFWAVDKITIDGIIRSDNRGNERIFPKYRLDADGDLTSNLSNQLFDFATDHWHRFEGNSFKQQQIPESVFQYMFGLFHVPTYRERFQPALCTDYPRIVFSKDEHETKKIIDAGRQLLRLKLESVPSLKTNAQKPLPIGMIGKPEFDSETQSIKSGEKSFQRVMKSDWEFRVGSHQVLRKWLMDRKGKEWTSEIASDFQKILQTIQEIQVIVRGLVSVDLG